MQGVEECMELNIRLNQMSKSLKTQFYIDNLAMIFNPQALFSDGTRSVPNWMPPS